MAEEKEPKPLLPSVNPITVLPPGTVRKSLTQGELENLHELQEAFYNARNAFIKEYRRIQKCVTAGYRIQKGSYQLRAGVRRVRRIKGKAVIIDLKGEDFYQELLEGTPPHEYLHVAVK